MITIDAFIRVFPTAIKAAPGALPWEISTHLTTLLETAIANLNDDYHIEEGIAIHRTAIIEQGVTLKRPVLVSADCFVGANAYFREGVFLDERVKIGAGCEIKSSLICSKSSIAHLNYIGNSIIGHHVNVEAGAIAANHYNERKEKEIWVNYRGTFVNTRALKFGALVGDHSKIGANAVPSPGTLLEPHSIVKRLALIEQVLENENQ